MFFWTPPHFWALSLYACGDYDRAGVPMLPVVRGPRVTRVHIMAYTVVLVPISLAPALLGLSGLLYGGAAALLGAGFLFFSFRVLRDRQDETGQSLSGDKPARRAFRFSLVYLALLFAAVAVDHFV